VLSSSKYLLTYLQYPSHQPVPIPSPPSHLFTQYFPNGGYASAGVYHSPQHYRSHSDPHSHSRHYSPNYSTHYAHNYGHRHVQPAPVAAPVQVPMQVRHSSRSQPRRPSSGDGPRIADFHINPALAYPSHSHSEPVYTHTKPILRNKGGPPLVPAVSHRITPPGGRTHTEPY
jgi:hypothetical protein